MRICIAGRNSIAIQVCKYVVSHYPLMDLYVIPSTQDCGKDTFQYSLRKYATDNGLPIISLEDVYDWEGMIFLSVEYDRILDVGKFKSDRLFNIHLSKLPKYKGMYTSALPILNGEAETGVTLHRIEKGIDTGDIIAQYSIPIDDEETCESLYKKLYKYGSLLVKENLERLFSGDYVAIPQSAKESSYYSKNAIDYSHLQIDLNQTACSIDRQLRAFHFRAYQLPFVFGYPIMHAFITNEKSKIRPGTVLEDGRYSVTLSTIDYNIILYKDRYLELVSMCASGDLKGLMSVPDIHYYADETVSVQGNEMLLAAWENGHMEVVDYLKKKGFSPRFNA